MNKVDYIIKGNLRNMGLENKFVEYKLILHWKEIVGEQISKVAIPRSLTMGTLFITVCEPIWMHQLAFLKDKILEKINNFLNKKEIKKIIFKYGIVKNMSQYYDNSSYSRIESLKGSFFSQGVSDYSLDKTLKGVNKIKDNELKGILKNIYDKIIL